MLNNKFSMLKWNPGSIRQFWLVGQEVGDSALKIKKQRYKKDGGRQEIVNIEYPILNIEVEYRNSIKKDEKKNQGRKLRALGGNLYFLQH
jgi:hypothetical protein